MDAEGIRDLASQLRLSQHPTLLPAHHEKPRGDGRVVDAQMVPATLARNAIFLVISIRLPKGPKGRNRQTQNYQIRARRNILKDVYDFSPSSSPLVERRQFPQPVSAPTKCKGRVQIPLNFKLQPVLALVRTAAEA